MMKKLSILAAGLCLGGLAWGATVAGEGIEIPTDLITIGVDGGRGGELQTFSLNSTPGDLAAEEGLLNEGFGVGSFYLPNRRLNERLEILEEFTGRPVMRFSYDCDGPNIEGLRVERTMELVPGEASLRVRWSVENRGKQRQWVSPWMRNVITPGGAVDPGDIVEIPTFRGIQRAGEPAYYPASRNWAAATDPETKETLWSVFRAGHLHSFLAWNHPNSEGCGFHAAFVPRLLAPGEKWETVYRVNAARGLSHVNFAGDDLAGQLDYAAGQLVLLLAATTDLPGMRIEARVLAENGRVWRLPPKQFSLDPMHLARCTYDWTPPGDGAYTFLAQLTRNGEPYDLGADTASPHGGIDTQFTTGAAQGAPMEAWTDAPHMLDRGPRMRDVPLAAVRQTSTEGGDPVHVWFETGLEKVFSNDRHAGGAIEPTHRLALAGNEAESFQVVIRPPAEHNLVNIRIQTHPLEQVNGGAVIPADNLSVHNVEYVPVRIPSHFEGPTGAWPDPLPPFEPFTAEGGEAWPIWFTLRTAPAQPPGRYRGMVEIFASGADPIELWLEVEVFPFSLPKMPLLKTDFGFSPQTALAGAGRQMNEAALLAAYRDNAASHRVTLRELAAFPPERAGYDSVLESYGKRVSALRDQGFTTFAAPPSLLDTPELLEAANRFVAAQSLGQRAFVQLAEQPEEPAWPRLLETMQQWKDRAPDIPIMVTTRGLAPFIPQGVDIWCVHAQVFDTTHHKEIVEGIRAGHETWWYVNHTPPRPYGNFFLDFAAIEHRILFWQSWALGVRGMHYWNVNYLEEGQDPWRNQLDITPVNGDGFLVYPGPRGPIDSIRWEVIRDGIEDFDYLGLLMEYRRRLEKLGGHESLLRRADAAYDLSGVVPDLVSFTRDPAALLAKRLELGRILGEMSVALRR